MGARNSGCAELARPESALVLRRQHLQIQLGDGPRLGSRVISRTVVNDQYLGIRNTRDFEGRSEVAQAAGNPPGRVERWYDD